MCVCCVLRAEMEENMHWVSLLLASWCLKAPTKSASSFGKDIEHISNPVVHKMGAMSTWDEEWVQRCQKHFFFLVNFSDISSN